MPIEYSFARTAADEAEVLEFYRRMFPAPARVVELLEWRRQCPELSGGNLTFAARADGRLVGAMNLVPLDLRVHDKMLRAAWQQDSIVSRELRGKGIGRELINRSAAEFDVILAKGTSDAMYKLRKACGFQDVVNSNYLVRVLSAARFGKSLRHKSYGAALEALSLLQRRRQRTEVTAIPMERFGAEFDAVTQTFGARPSIRPVKTSTFLNWRYRQCPGREYKILGAVSQARITGAAVVTTQQTSWIVDVLVDNSDTPSLVALIRAAVDGCRANGAASVHAFATSRSARRCLKAQGFVEVPRTPRFTFRARVPGGPIEEALLRSADWDFWHGDGDVELYD